MRKDATRCCYVLPPDMKACIDLCRLPVRRAPSRGQALSARALTGSHASSSIDPLLKLTVTNVVSIYLPPRRGSTKAKVPRP